MGSHIIDRTIAEGTFSETFSTLNLLRNYNNLIASNSENRHLETYPRSEYLREPSSGVEPGMLTTGPLSGLAPTAPFSIGGLLQPPLLAAVPPLVPPVGLAAAHPFANASAVAAVSRNIIENAVISSMHHTRRPRSEKKPIPDEQKDEKYYERRKRNNQAAKKSRDARKIREDQIALRATVLEYENARLRARMVELYEECQSLRQLLIKERLSSSEPPPPPPPPSAPSHASSTSSGDPLSNRVVSSTVVSSTPTKSASISLGPSPC